VEGLVSQLRKEHKLRQFDDRVWSKIFGPKNGEDYIMRGFILTIYHMGDKKMNEMAGACVTNGDRRGA
jgi:hypothetical protein